MKFVHGEYLRDELTRETCIMRQIMTAAACGKDCFQRLKMGGDTLEYIMQRVLDEDSEAIEPVQRKQALFVLTQPNRSSGSLAHPGPKSKSRAQSHADSRSNTDSQSDAHTGPGPESHSRSISSSGSPGAGSNAHARYHADFGFSENVGSKASSGSDSHSRSYTDSALESGRREYRIVYEDSFSSYCESLSLLFGEPFVFGFVGLGTGFLAGPLLSFASVFLTIF